MRCPFNVTVPSGMSALPNLLRLRTSLIVFSMPALKTLSNSAATSLRPFNVRSPTCSV